MPSLLKIEEPTPSVLKPSWRDFLSLGFRPLYLCGAAWAIVAVSLWVYAPQLLQGQLTGVFWHAHEMLWGFVAAIAVGFLLTAASNWTGTNPLHGRALGVLTALWATARVAYLVPGSIAFGIASAADLAFFAMAAWAIARCLWSSKSQNNYGLPALLLGMGIANAAFLIATARHADYLQVMHFVFTGLLCMLSIALLMARRVLPFFASRAVPGLELDRHTRSGQWQLGLVVLAMLCWQFGFSRSAALLLTLGALITLWHLIAWKPWRVLRTPLLWILYVGYAGMGLGLLAAAQYVQGWSVRMSWPVHVIAVAGFAPLILGMVVRTALGHTGRMLQADKLMVTSFVLLLIGMVLRLCALHAAHSYLALLHASAAFWSLAFGLYLWRFTPFLIRPRADQRPGKPVALRRA